MKGFAQKSADFLRQEGVARILVVALFARMPIGMVGFAMLMFLRESLGDYALAGSAVGINFFAMAVAAPVQGRLIDRIGPRQVLWVTGIVSPLALVAMLAAVNGHWPYWTIAVLSGICGAFASPITTLTRTLWRQRFDREEDRRTAFAFDAVTIELNFTLGPAIIAAVLATAGARAAFALAIAVVVFSFVVYMASGILAGFRRVESTERHLLGPLTERRLWVVFMATFGLCTCFGLLEVGYPAFATSIAVPAVAGILLASNSLGSAFGGLAYGGMHFRAPVERQFATAMGLMAIPLALHMPFLTPIPLGILAFLVGGLIAPSITAQSVLVSRYAPEKYATEAFTWSSAVIVCGLGAGIALGGMLVESLGLRTAFGLGAALMAGMSLLILVFLPPTSRDIPPTQ